MRKKKSTGILEKTAEIFDLPGEAAAGLPRITITGTGRAHVENHRGLLEYSDQQIVVNAGSMMIRIKGEKLNIAAMSDMELVVTGKIAAAEFLV
ncbi:MAG: YabP/YqfC family sporulation protein [Oscillospiraceae bacterium]